MYKGFYVEISLSNPVNRWCSYCHFTEEETETWWRQRLLLLVHLLSACWRWPESPNSLPQMSGHWATVLVKLPCIQKSSYHTLSIACPSAVPCVLFCNRTSRLFTMGLSQLFLVHIWGCGPQTNISYSLLFSKPSECVSSWLWVTVCFLPEFHFVTF